ncbi:MULTISPECIES: hypothetical protein [Marinobacter]|uniref:hypothetical protein n=1 Tax=Marinobacter TaxID=2742 RepID=UPI000DAE1220|nr:MULTISPECIES: hypothetical protein [Marinobacter]
MRPDEPNRSGAFLLAGLLLLLGGCASSPQTDVPTPLPPAQPDESGAEPAPDAADREPAPDRSAPAPRLCAWSKTRGVAKLLAQEQDRGTWQFFPGDDVVFHEVPGDAGQGAEFRAILERPLNGPCDQERLILVAPLLPAAQ